MAIPSASQIATTQNYVSSANFIAAVAGKGDGLHKPEVSEDFVKRYGSQNLTGFLDMIGAKAPVSNFQFSHYEEDWIHQSFKADDSAADVALTGGVQILIDASSHLPSASAAGATSFVRPGSVVLFPTGEVGLVVAKWTSNQSAANETLDGYAGTLQSGPTPGVNNHVIHVMNYDSGTAITVAESATLTIIGTEFAEGTGQPNGITPKVLEYNNTCMILKESYQVTGSEATNKIWFQVTDEATGQSGHLWYLKGEGDTYRRFMDYAEMMMILGEQATSTSYIAAGGTNNSITSGVRGTNGLLSFMGNTHTYNQLAGFNLSDFDAMIRTLDKNKGSRENSVWCGLDLSLAIDDAIAAMFAGGGVSYGTFNGAEEIAAAMGFKSFTRGGYTFHKKSYHPFTHLPMLGADGFDYAGMGMVIPGDSGRDAQSGESIPSLRIRYKAAEGYSREMEHWLTGSAGLAQATSDVDELRCHYRTERGFEGYGANRFIKIQRA
tara:strand:- start:1034 stop:2512 length:1479 start_codon:yes stop_codon:yes gene_type:complete